MKKTIEPYYVLSWNFNRDNVEYLDIMPYLIDEYKQEKKRKHKVFCKTLETKSDYREFILAASKYRYWSKSEYEVLVDGFPPSGKCKKIDIYDQIEKNIAVIVTHFVTQI